MFYFIEKESFGEVCDQAVRYVSLLEEYVLRSKGTMNKTKTFHAEESHHFCDLKADKSGCFERESKAVDVCSTTGTRVYVVRSL